MSTSDEYRAKAAELTTRAKNEPKLSARAEFERLALSYLRLADQATKNAANDVVYETPLQQQLSQPAQQQQQQQHQHQSEKKD